MIRRIQVLHYRCLRYVDVMLGRFQVLVGATGSGKSALLDAIALLSDLVREGPEAAVISRADDFRDLVWGRPEEDPRFEIAAEFEISEDLREKLGSESNFQRFRYEIALADRGGGPCIESERGILIPGATESASPQESLFSDPPPETVPSGSRRRGSMTVFSKSATGNDSFNVETAGAGGKGWAVRIAFGPRRSTMANLPDAPGSFPVATRIRQTLTGQVKRMALDEAGLGHPSPPGWPAASLEPDGSNLPAAVGRFRETDAAGFADWIAHLRTALPGLEDVLVTERPSDRHACVSIRDTSGVQLPLSAVSGGALRLIVLTLLARLPDSRGIWLIPNEVDGLDVPSLQAAYRSLSSAPRVQVLVETRSPWFLACAEPSEILCFSHSAEGGTAVVAGHTHPEFDTWSGKRDNLKLFAPEFPV